MVTPSPLPEWIPRRLLTVDELAELLNLSPRHIWRLIASRKLPVVRVGRSTRVTPEAAAALMGVVDQ